MVSRIVIAGAVISLVAGVLRLTVPYTHPWGALFLDVIPALLAAITTCVALLAMLRRRVGPARLLPGQVDGQPALVAPPNREWRILLAALPWTMLGITLSLADMSAFHATATAFGATVAVLVTVLLVLGRPTLALRSEGVANMSRLGGWVVPWTALGQPATDRPADPGAFNAVLELRVDRPELVRFERFGRSRPAPAQLRFELRLWDVDPTFLADAIDSRVVPAEG